MTTTRLAPTDGYLAHSRRPLASLVFVLPLIVLYEFGTWGFHLDPARHTERRIVAFTWLREAFASLGATGPLLAPLSVVVLLLGWHVFTPRAVAGPAGRAALHGRRERRVGGAAAGGRRPAQRRHAVVQRDGRLAAVGRPGRRGGRVRGTAVPPARPHAPARAVRRRAGPQAPAGVGPVAAADGRRLQRLPLPRRRRVRVARLPVPASPPACTWAFCSSAAASASPPAHTRRTTCCWWPLRHIDTAMLVSGPVGNLFFSKLAHLDNLSKRS